MIGMVLAAGAGRRLGPLTEDLPKTLLQIDDERSILDLAIGNLKQVGIEDVVVVTGFAAERVDERKTELEKRYGVKLECVFNDKAEIWNNAYSLWCARELFSEGVLLVNGDTVHPASVEERLLESRGSDIVIAIDDDLDRLNDESMKVQLSEEGFLRRITKQMPVTEGRGEYIGLTLIEPAAAERLAEALEATWQRDPQLYYEDGFQEFVDRGGTVATAPIGRVDWVEVDDDDDLGKARELACRF
jgi:choline kinase